MKVMVIGNGGREHAIVWKLAQSPSVSKIYCTPGNGGTAAIAENVPLESIEAMAEFAFAQQIDLTVVGPETYLAAGVVDTFQKKGLRIYGPSQAAAQLESSKVYLKEFLRRHRIPTARYESFTDPEAARNYLKTQQTPIVVKADGLAAGKGVVVAFEMETALHAIDQIMTDRVFGESGAAVVIEEYMDGEEVSLLAFCDGNIAVPMLPAQDHKRIGDGDTGPNTGGMGTYAPTSAYTPAIAEGVVTEILNPTIAAMKKEGTPFVGTLFAGLMITKDGPKIIEYNVRFGDPETQVVLPLLQSDLARIFWDATEGKLNPDRIQWATAQQAVCVVAASLGYPGAYPIGKRITGLEEVTDSLIFHAGTKSDPDGQIVTAGGRVLNVVHLGKTIQAAVAGAYHAVQQVFFEGIYYRKDIAGRELNRGK